MLCAYFPTNSPVHTVLLFHRQIYFTRFFPPQDIARFIGRSEDDDGVNEMQYTSSILGGVMDRQKQTEVTRNQRFGRKKDGRVQN
jgi:hypothetical protein